MTDNTASELSRISDPLGVYCVLELRFPGNSNVPDRRGSLFHVFPVMPESMRMAQRYLQTITPTQGGVFVDEFGRAPSPIVLQGTFGRSPNVDLRLLVDGAAGNGSSLTGYKMAKLLSKMVDYSHQPVGGVLPTAYFYNFAFDQFHEVALNSYQAQMSVDFNGLWTYQLEMTVLRDMAASDRSKFTLPPLRSVADGEATQQNAQRRIARRLQAVFDRVQKARSVTTDTIGKVNQFLTVNGALSFAFTSLDKVIGLRPGTLGQFYDTLQRLPQLASGVKATIDAAKRLPADLQRDLIATRDGIKTAISDIGAAVASIRKKREDALTPASDIPASFLAATVTGQVNGSASGTSSIVDDSSDLRILMDALEDAQNAQEVIDQLFVLAELVGAVDSPASYVNISRPGSLVETGSAGTTDYVVRQGDTLATIAMRTYGSADLWTVVANDLPDEMKGISPTEPLDAFVGTSLGVPQTTAPLSGLVPDVWVRPVGQAAFGTDLPSTFTTETLVDGKRTLTVLDNSSTLVQGIEQRLALSLGSSTDRPEFGTTVSVLIGETFGFLQPEMMRALMRETIAKDPRIASVDQVLVTQEKDALFVQFAATSVTRVPVAVDGLAIALT